MKKKIAGLILIMLALNACSFRSIPQEQELPTSSDSEFIVSQGEEKQELQSPPESEPEEAPFSSSQENQPVQPPEADSSSETDLAPETTEDWMLVLANFENPLPDGYEPELKEVQNGYKMEERVADIMIEMIADAKADGVDLLVCSAYRPYSSQERIFNNSVDAYMNGGKSYEQAVVETAKLIAKPGTSEHQTGLAADIVTPSYQNLDSGFEQTKAFQWLSEHAVEYGFILRYPADKVEITKIDYEPWHYRYVGQQAAKAIKEQGLCLEEYLS
ncbi:M15 family metallopeptidase [Youxingia wuxianensis]|uniref:M15 family metallopeptidase n=1 Tax=Youxingia wuxianensis TaxID=2763678 RepID=A0A926EIK1_9FIRM|nr:M15 family metallopeptidase [Youxingia wuxianensis]MBC8584013.1 M15 family metallopeptidase [Youxingia wuxianensis]